MLLRMGDRGEAVQIVQRAIREAGFDMVVDGIFGRNTRAAVMEFQRQNSLAVDGIVGPQTLGALGLDPDFMEQDPDNQSDHSDPLEGDFDEDRDSNFPEGGNVDWTGFKAEVVRLANQEWERWHEGGKKTETDEAVTSALQDYYSTGVQEDIESRQLRDSNWQENHPWSAVFISWVMRTAGASNKFRYSTAHQRYVAAAKENRESNITNNPFWAFRIDEVAPEVGDLVCASRANSGATYENIDDGFKAAHCDIVTEVRPNELIVIGGNVGNTVGKKTIQTDDQGFVILMGSQNRFFSVLRVRTDLVTFPLRNVKGI